VIRIDPIKRALVAADSKAADSLGAPNYDEFQSDREVWELLQQRPASVLRITMPQCDVASPSEIGAEDAPAALNRARENLSRLIDDDRTHELHDILWIYEITRAERPASPQIGLGGMARTSDIRTEQNPAGSIIRNEGIREAKARGRAKLTEATRADLGMVNLAVDDATGAFRAGLEAYANASAPSFETSDETGNRHCVWLVQDAQAIARFRALLANEPHAYVADGNHRSAAAAMLGYEHFLAVFFPAASMTIAPYNRLVKETASANGNLQAALGASFEVEPYDGEDAYQPAATHEVGLYDRERWWRLRPRPGTFDPGDAAQDIDADIVQRKLFAEVLGIPRAGDERLTFVGANRDARWLQNEVDAGRFRYAVTLPAVTMQQFVNVCLQNRLMPPKSTWFVPKIRTGLVLALLD
jgi:uncharacterized protein (DUF1015 family)